MRLGPGVLYCSYSSSRLTATRNPPVAYDVVCRQSLTGCGVGIQLGRPPLRGVPGAAAQHGRQREEGRRKDVAAAGALPRPAAVSERSGN